MPRCRRLMWLGITAATMLWVAGLAATSAQATEYIWTGASPGNDRLWSTTTNWSPSGTPGASDTVKFTGTSLGSVNLSGDRAITTASFENSSGTYTLTDSTRTLTAGTIQQTAAATGAVNEVQTKVLGTGGNLTLTISAGSLKFSGQVGTSSTAVNLAGTVAGGATLDFANASTTALKTSPAPSRSAAR